MAPGDGTTLAAILLTSMPATSAGPYTIEVGAEAHAYYFAGVHQCEDSAFYDSPLNGFSERLVNIRSFAGKRVKLTWSAQQYVDSPEVKPYIRGGYYTTACKWRPGFNQMSRFESPARFTVPSYAKWLWVTGLSWVKASFTIVLDPL